jgi:hypothetical protein
LAIVTNMFTVRDNPKPIPLKELRSNKKCVT